MILIIFSILFIFSFPYVYTTDRNLKSKIEGFKIDGIVYIPGSGIAQFVSLKCREFDMETFPTAFFISLFLHEDRKFVRHSGFNWPEIFRAGKSTLLGKRVKGGSSICQ